MKIIHPSISRKYGFRFSIFILALTVFVSACTEKNKTASAVSSIDIVRCGTVQFSGSCGPELDSFIAYGLALVHHMTFDEAEVVFDKIIEDKPDCFWGPWGKALTFIHPLWPDEPSKEQMKLGWELSQRAMSLAKQEKEKLFGNALVAFYKDGAGKLQKDRLKNYEAAWTQAYEKLPGDTEAKTFYALSYLATADPTDKTYSKQLKAGQMMAEILEANPDHPGGFHYMIHAYDYPELAKKAMDAATKYKKMAPEVPHALHMPTHIYTRLGLWNEAIEWNKRSAKVAFSRPANGQISRDYFHAQDYLIYAHLQKLEDHKAKKLIDEIKNLDGKFQIHAATAYTLASLEARYALERQQWAEASNLVPIKKSNFTWDEFPEFEAVTHFAIGIGAARSGNPAKAEATLNLLDELKKKIKNPYWKEQVNIQQDVIRGWLAYAKGSQAEALKYLTIAADKENATSKHPITPGELLPATELLGDMLMEYKKPGEALAAYEKALSRSPGRLNSIYGASLAAEHAGDAVKAKTYRENLKKLTENAEVPLTTKFQPAIAKAS